ncbi:MAG: phenylalanine--tRNA ligase subunit beta [Acidobacteriota bacterium]
MKFSYRWLADYVELGAPSAAAAEDLGRRLTAVGLNVEAIDPIGAHGDDFVLDADITTNRPDCMNHLGLAREAAVALGKPLRVPAVELDEAAEPTAKWVQVGIDPEAAVACPRYVARIVRRVKVGPSPEWLQARLRAIGQRPINNVVDVTNFVLWETGQPLHAFDLGKIARGASSLPEIHVRFVTAGEVLRTLDGVERKLDPSILVIADPSRAVALAGIMGGEATKVRDDAGTVDVLIESAHFDRAAVRRGARALGMHTDASHRFERGTDPEGCAAAADRAAALLGGLGGGEVLRGAVEAHGELPVPRCGRLVLDRLQRFVGAEIPAAEVERILGGLGFELEPRGGEWEVRVPSWRTFDFEPRPDGFAEEADLFEEALRQWGFDRVAPALPAFVGKDPGQSPEHDLRERARDLLWAAGFAETINFAFEENAADARFPALVRAGAPLELANPLQETHRVLRRSLLPNLVEAALHNLRRGAGAVRLFEIAHVFPGADDPEGEFDAVALVMGGTLGTPWERARELDFFDLKGAIEGLAAGLGSALEARAATIEGMAPGSAADFWRDAPREERVGYIGCLAGIDAPVALYAAELRLAAIAGPAEPQAVEAPSRFPGVTADLTLTHGLDVPWSDLAAAIAARRVPDLRRFGLKDRYRGTGVPDGAVKTTIHFLYNAEDRSLTQDEVNERHQALSAALVERFGWREER